MSNWLGMPNCVLIINIIPDDGQRMKIRYASDMDYRCDVRILMSLPYIPAEDIPRVFTVVTEYLEEKGSEAVMLLPRLDKFYVNGNCTIPTLTHPLGFTHYKYHKTGQWRNTKPPICHKNCIGEQA